MAPLIVGIFIALIGAFLTAGEARGCAYERSNLGPFLILVGVVLVIGAGIDPLI